MLIIFHIIFLQILNQINTQTCGVKDPKSFKDCKDDSSKNSICCFAHVSLMEKEETLCVFVPKSQIFITPFISSMDIGLSPDNIAVELDCGYKPGDIPENQSYSVCGENPKNENDCFINSIENASCCYINNPDNNSVCLLNNGIYKKNDTYFGIRITCNEKFLNLGFIGFLMFFLIIFL